MSFEASWAWACHESATTAAIPANVPVRLLIEFLPFVVVGLLRARWDPSAETFATTLEPLQRETRNGRPLTMRFQPGRPWRANRD